MSNISSFAEGFANSLNSYLQTNQKQQREQANEKYKQGLEQQNMQMQSDLNVQSQKTLENYKQDLAGVMTPETAESMFGTVSPELGAAAKTTVMNWMQGNGGKPMPMSVAKAAMDPVLTAFGNKMLAKSVKDQADSEKQQQEQDKLEKQYADRLQKVISFRSGGLGLQDSKVNQAIDLRTLLNQYYDPKTDTYNVPPAQHSEIALGLARLVSPQGTVPIELEKQLRQSTGREALSNALIYAGFDPSQIGGPTQSVIKMFRDSVDRQGATAERLRDQYVTGLKGLVPTRLSKDRADRLNKAEMTSSFNDFLNNSPDHQKHLATSPVPGTVVKGYKFLGGDPGDQKNWEKQ